MTLSGWICFSVSQISFSDLGKPVNSKSLEYEEMATDVAAETYIKEISYVYVKEIGNLLENLHWMEKEGEDIILRETDIMNIRSNKRNKTKTNKNSNKRRDDDDSHRYKNIYIFI